MLDIEMAICEHIRYAPTMFFFGVTLFCHSLVWHTSAIHLWCLSVSWDINCINGLSEN